MKGRPDIPDHPTDDQQKPSGAPEAPKGGQETSKFNTEDELGRGSAKLTERAKRNVQRFMKSMGKMSLGPLGSAMLALGFAFLSSFFYSFVAIVLITLVVWFVDLWHPLTDFLLKWYVVISMIVMVILAGLKLMNVRTRNVEEGQRAIMALFDGWLLGFFSRYIVLTPGEHLEFLSFANIYVFSPSYVGMVRKVESVTCKGVGGTTGAIPLGDGKGGPMEVVVDLRVIDGVELVQAKGMMGPEAVVSAVQQFIDNATRDGMAPAHYDKVEQAQLRDQEFVRNLYERHGKLLIQLPDNDWVLPIPGTGYAITKFWIQACLTNDKTLLDSRSKPSIVRAEATALKTAHRNLIEMIVDQKNKTGIDTAMDPLAASLALNNEVQTQAFMLTTNAATTRDVAAIGAAVLGGISKAKEKKKGDGKGKKKREVKAA